MEAGQLVGGRFEIDRLAGRGGMGAVYRARDTHTGAAVAIKVLVDARLDPARFRREAELLKSLEDPHIVRYVAHGETDAGAPFLAMEWLEGRDLVAQLERGRLTVGESVTLARRVAGALAAAHTRGMVHRDVKPANLFLVGGEVDRVKLLDFGIARGRASATVQTRTGLVLGSIGYMAPEQVRGERGLDARADVFALGCVLFECLTGRPTFGGDHPMAALAKILFEDPPRVAALVPDCPALLDALVAAMLAKLPDERPADAIAVARALEEIPAAGAERRGAPADEPAAITETEARYVNVVVASQSAGEAATANTLAPAEQLAELDRIREAVAPLGARIEALNDGSLVATVAGGGVAVDQAVRACRCALLLRVELPGWRVAIATGRAVLAGAMPLGEAVDRAVRLLGEPQAASAIALDDVTATLVEGRLDVDSAGSVRRLRGGREAGLAQHRLLGKAVKIVGRARELAMLEAALDHSFDEPAAAGALVTGPPGAGKSRLLHELVDRLRGRGDAVTIWKANGDPLRAGAPFAMLGQLVRAAAGVVEGEPLTARADRLRAFTEGLLVGPDAARAAVFLGEISAARTPEQSSEDLARARTDAVLFATAIGQSLLAVLGAVTRVGPLVLALEDLHWGDAQTVDCVLGALRELSERPLFVLALARPEIGNRFPALREADGIQEIRLGALGKRAAESLVRQVLGDAVPSAVVARVIEGAAGNAFALEELIRAESEGHGERVPETVLAMLQARVESFDPHERRVLRAASVLGEVFWTGAVSELTGGRRDEALEVSLANLVAREAVAPAASSRFPAEREYCFRHALLRDAAYAMLPDADRRLAHRLAAQWLERVGESEGRVLAEHLERGAEDDATFLAAARAWLRAGQHTAQRFALVEAVTLLRRGLACAERVSAGEPRDRATWELSMALGPALGATDGLQARSVRETLLRTIELGDRLGEPARSLPALIGLYANHLIRAEYAEAGLLAERCHDMTRQSPDAELRIQGLRPLWNVKFYTGDLRACVRAAAEAEALHEAAQVSAARVLYVADAVVNALSFHGAALWYLGRPDAAVAWIGKAVERAEAVGQPYTKTMLVQNRAFVAAGLEDADGARRAGELSRELGQRHHFDLFERVADLFLGIADVLSGQHLRAIELFGRGMERCRGIEARLGATWARAWWSRALLALGQSDEALAEADRALANVVATGERLWLVQSLVARGEALFARGDHGDALVVFGDGLAVAREQGALSLELIAQRSLSRALAKDDPVGAATALAAVLDRFEEGFATRPLVEARREVEHLRRAE